MTAVLQCAGRDQASVLAGALVHAGEAGACSQRGSDKCLNRYSAAWLQAACAAGQAREVLARVGLAEQFGAMPAQLTAAQQQRVALARAVAAEPALLLCDDVASSSADPELAGEVALALRALAFDGLAVLLATPDLDFAHSVADRVVFLHGGRVLTAAPADRARRSFTATPVSESRQQHAAPMSQTVSVTT